MEPLLRRVRSGIRIPNQVRTVAGKAGNLRRAALQGNISRVEYRKWRATHQGDNAVELPVAKCVLVPGVSLSPEGDAPLITQCQAVAGIEHRTAALGV